MPLCLCVRLTDMINRKLPTGETSNILYISRALRGRVRIINELAFDAIALLSHIPCSRVYGPIVGGSKHWLKFNEF